MHKTLVSSIIILSTFYMVNSSSLYAMEIEEETYEELRKWTPVRLHNENALNNLYKKIEEEKTARTLISTEAMATRTDFGYSFAGLNYIQEACLTEISQRNTKDSSRPQVLDDAAGHGFMSWKMLVAGGLVTAIEKQKPTAQELQKNISQAKEFLAPEEKLKDIIRLRVGDVLNFNQDIYNRKDYYDIIWSSHLLHFFTPQQTDVYIPHIYTITKPGGLVYAQVMAPSGNPTSVSCFFENQQNQDRFPGYMILNREIYRSPKTDDRNLLREVEEARALKEGNLAPGSEFLGYYGKSESKEIWEKVRLSDKQKEDIYTQYPDLKDDLKDVRKRKTHTVVHFFDPTSLKAQFERAGFKVQEFFYIKDGQKCEPSNVTRKDLETSLYFTGVIAKKPS